MNRNNATIQNIESLFPADHDFKAINEIGNDLLNEAIKNTGFNWRDLPDNVLKEYERLCINKERAQATDIWKKYF